MLQTIISFYAKISQKSLSISAETYEKYIVCKDCCIADHDDKTCSLPAWKYHMVLHGGIEKLLREMDTFLFHLSTRGLSLYPVQVPLRRKNYCKEWKCV